MCAKRKEETLLNYEGDRKYFLTAAITSMCQVSNKLLLVVYNHAQQPPVAHIVPFGEKRLIATEEKLTWPMQTGSKVMCIYLYLLG